MSSIYLGVSVVFPLLCYMLIGIILKKAGWLSEKTLTDMNRLVFRLFLFSLIFLNSYSVNIADAFHKENLQVLMLALAAVLAAFAISRFICGKMGISKARKAIIVQGIYRSNLVLFGLPVSLSIYGEGNQSAIALLIAVIVPLYNIIAALLLANASGEKTTGTRLVKQVFLNPLVLGSFLGLAFNMLGISFPKLIMDTITGLSKVATPLAFIVLGGSLVFDNFRKDLKAVLSICIIRLVVLPLVVIGIGITLGMRNQAIVALLGTFASSTAVASYTMAKNAEVESELAGEIVAATTVISILTMFLWITGLNYFGII